MEDGSVIFVVAEGAKVQWGVIGTLAGVAVGFLLNFGVDLYKQRRRSKALGQAMRAEIKLVGREIARLLQGGVESPIARLPTYCFDRCFSELILTVHLKEEEVRSILEFYDLAHTTNRSLDNAMTIFADREIASEPKRSELNRILVRERNRIALKGSRIASARAARGPTRTEISEGSHYRPALQVTDRWADDS